MPKLKQLVEVVGYEVRGAGHFDWPLMVGSRLALNFNERVIFSSYSLRSLRQCLLCSWYMAGSGPKVREISGPTHAKMIDAIEP